MLTKTHVDQLEQSATVWDTGRGSVAGFGVRRQTRLPSFVLKYTIGGRQRWYTIGKYGSPWTVEEARLEAKRLLGQIASGVDPAVARDTPASITMSELCVRYMAAATAGAVLTRFNRPKKASTLADDRGRIARHIVPLIGRQRVTDIDPQTVRRLISDITVGKTAATVTTKLRGQARVRGGASTAARVADLLSGMLTWAVDEGILSQNPVHRVRRFRAQSSDRFLNEDETARLGIFLKIGKDTAGRPFHPHAVSIVRLLCLTGCRKGEIGALRWDEVDFDMSCLRLEDTKTGRSLRPIGSEALGILKAQARLSGQVYVFPASRGDGAYQGLGKEVPRIFKAAEIGNASAHTLRHTFASTASGLGYSDGTIAGLLGHRGRTVTSRYVHRPDQALASAAEAISNQIETILAGIGCEGTKIEAAAAKIKEGVCAVQPILAAIEEPASVREVCSPSSSRTS